MDQISLGASYEKHLIPPDKVIKIFVHVYTAIWTTPFMQQGVWKASSVPDRSTKRDDKWGRGNWFVLITTGFMSWGSRQTALWSLSSTSRAKNSNTDPPHSWKVIVPGQFKLNTTDETEGVQKKNPSYTPRFCLSKACSACFLPNEAFYNADEKIPWWNRSIRVGTGDVLKFIHRKIKEGTWEDEQR